MTPRRWRQIGWMGAALATISATAYAVSLFQGVMVCVPVSGQPLAAFPGAIERRGLQLGSARGALFIVWLWWDSEPSDYYLLNRFPIENPRTESSFSTKYEDRALIIGWPYPAALGIIAWALGKRRGRENAQGFPVQPT